VGYRVLLVGALFFVSVSAYSQTGGQALLAHAKQTYEDEPASSIDEFANAIATLQLEGDVAVPLLVDAWVYKGAAYLHKLDETSAKGCFRAALRLQPTLRLTRSQWPPRVVRVFDATRSGQAKSVMEPPSGAPKKAGIGAATIGLIVGGVALAAGGAAAVAAHGSSSTPTPVPTSTPNPSTLVIPIGRSGAGAEVITFMAADPPPGSTLQLGQPITIEFTIANTDPTRTYSVLVDLDPDAQTACGLHGEAHSFSAATSSVTVEVHLSWAALCPPSNTLRLLTAALSIPQSDLVHQSWNVTYPLASQ
jgi:hypothetical protein